MAGYIIMMFVIAAAAGGYAYYFIRRTMKFYGLDEKKRIYKIAALILAAGLVAVCANLWTTRAMVFLHLIFVSIILDVLAMIGRRVFQKKKETRSYLAAHKIYRCGILPLLVTALLFVYGFGNMEHVVKTEYTVETEKNIADYKVLMLTDTHYGTIQNKGVLQEKISEMNEENPDLVILGGDMVEESTSKEDMEELFALLGGIHNNYGIFYVYGNHDRQPYTSNRTYTDEELEAAITNNGITILEDSYVEINEDLIVAGRGDAAWGNVSGRASSAEILQDVDQSKFLLMIDHQPIEAKENDAQGVDLEVSGHTHAGQIWPIGWISELTGVLNYGEYHSGNCEVIVSSGFTGWGYPIRTEGHCEYVVMNLTQE